MYYINLRIHSRVYALNYDLQLAQQFVSANRYSSTYNSILSVNKKANVTKMTYIIITGLTALIEDVAEDTDKATASGEEDSETPTVRKVATEVATSVTQTEVLIEDTIDIKEDFVRRDAISITNPDIS